MSWWVRFAAEGLAIWNRWFGGYNEKAVREARRINDERKKKAEFDLDLRKAASGDQQALDRVRAGVNSGP